MWTYRCEWEKEKIELMQEASQPLNHIVPIPLSV